MVATHLPMISPKFCPSRLKSMEMPNINSTIQNNCNSLRICKLRTSSSKDFKATFENNDLNLRYKIVSVTMSKLLQCALKGIIFLDRINFTPFHSKHLIIKETESIFALNFSFVGKNGRELSSISKSRFRIV